MLHSSPRLLDDQLVTSGRWEQQGRNIERALNEDETYPWAALTWLQAPKFLSDMVESLLGAMFLDSKGDLDVVRGVLRKLGVLRVLERIVDGDVDVLHPVSRLALWAAKNNFKVEYRIPDRKEGVVSCAVVVNEREVVVLEDQWRGRVSKESVRFAAAEAAMKILRLEWAEAKDSHDSNWGRMEAEYDDLPGMDLDWEAEKELQDVDMDWTEGEKDLQSADWGETEGYYDWA